MKCRWLFIFLPEIKEKKKAVQVYNKKPSVAKAMEGNAACTP
jgi:hypothetical protein